MLGEFTDSWNTLTSMKRRQVRCLCPSWASMSALIVVVPASSTDDQLYYDHWLGSHDMEGPDGGDWLREPHRRRFEVTLHGAPHEPC